MHLYKLFCRLCYLAVEVNTVILLHLKYQPVGGTTSVSMGLVQVLLDFGKKMFVFIMTNKNIVI